MKNHMTAIECLRPARLLVCTITALLLICIFVPMHVHAASNFIIRDYYVEMNVNKDDTYDIYEKLEVEFTADSHGIYRTIPYKTTLDRDGQVSTYYAKIRDFKMLSGQPFKLENKSDKAFYRIGDPNKFADTNTTYEYSYTYDTRGDHLEGADEVYYNLVGTSWEAQSIDKVKFKVVFPEDIDMSKVGMKNGNQVDIDFDNDGKRVISGETEKDTTRGLTIRAVLPEGYFTRQAGASSTLLYVLLGVLAVLALFGVVLWRTFGVDPTIVEPVEFYPPDGLSAPEVGYLKEGEIRGDHVTAMLLTLADKGYVKIREVKTQTAFLKREKTEYEIDKVKEYDGNTIGESTFMSGLFKGGSKTVKVSELTNTFYKTVEKIKKAVVKRYEKKLYDKKASECADLMILLGIIGMIALVVVTKLANGSPFIMGDGIIFSIIFLASEVGFSVAGFMMAASIFKSVRRHLSDIFLLVLAIVIWALGFVFAFVTDTFIPSQLLLYLIGNALVFLLFIISSFCQRKSDYYTDILGKIRGYERFLKSAEKERMETLAEEDPDYFYKNLAFAFALGVTGVFAKHFAALATKPPEWYDTYGTYNASTFSSVSMMDSLNSMMRSTSTSMTSSPSSSGGSGGGSFSGGGGGGGGGGGSW